MDSQGHRSRTFQPVDVLKLKMLVGINQRVPPFTRLGRPQPQDVVVGSSGKPSREEEVSRVCHLPSVGFSLQPHTTDRTPRSVPEV